MSLRRETLHVSAEHGCCPLLSPDEPPLTPHWTPESGQTGTWMLPDGCCRLWLQAFSGCTSANVGARTRPRSSTDTLWFPLRQQIDRLHTLSAGIWSSLLRSASEPRWCSAARGGFGANRETRLQAVWGRCEQLHQKHSGLSEYQCGAWLTGSPGSHGPSSTNYIKETSRCVSARSPLRHRLKNPAFCPWVCSRRIFVSLGRWEGGQQLDPHTRRVRLAMTRTTSAWSCQQKVNRTETTWHRPRSLLCLFVRLHTSSS